MQFEVLHRSKKKKFLIAGCLVVVVLLAIVLSISFAKYRVTKSMQLMTGTINFSPYDFNVVAMYLNKNGESIVTKKAPHVGYTLNTEQSTCMVDDEEVNEGNILFENGNLTFQNMNYSGTKCTLHFDLIPDSENPTVSISTSTDDTSITVVANATDNIGIYYYYFKLDDGEEVRLEENTYTFEGLQKDDVRTVTVRVEDAAGNEASTAKEVTVGLPTATEMIKNIYQDNQDILAYDDYDNLRYIGANPNNYVYFNCDDYNNPSNSTCELWRIIGVFSEDTHGRTGEKLVKLIRSESIGNMAWDTTGGMFGCNDWSGADLQESLNGSYLSGSYLGSGKGITNATNNMIEEVTWKLGAGTSYSNSSNGLASHWYGYERGTTVYSGRPTEWSGKIGLMYPSDYGYATNGGSTTNRTSCLAKELANWDDLRDCYNNDWLYYSSAEQWTLTSLSSRNENVFIFRYSYLKTENAYSAGGVRPSVYLKSNILITGGEGSSAAPFRLSP